MEEVFLGIDVGGTNLKFGVVSSEGELLYKKKYKTTDLRNSSDFVQSFIEIVRKELSEKGNIQKVGIGLPGMISKDRRIALEMANIPELNGCNLVERLEDTFPGKNFFLENDANAAALGELHFGEKSLPSSFIFITMGTGIGGAAIIDGEVFTGANGNGMEIGHIIAGNGKTVEKNIGKKGIVAIAEKLLEKKDKQSLLRVDRKLDPKEIVQAAKSDDKIALEVFKKVGEFLGECIISSVRALDISTVIIGGGISKTFDYVNRSMMKKIEQFLPDYYTKNLQIRLASLANNAGIIGAASLCFANKSKVPLLKEEFSDQRQKDYYKSLPLTFSTKEAKLQASKLEVPVRTAMYWLKKWNEDPKLLSKTQRGAYKKTLTP